LLETVACQHLISRREYLTDKDPLRQAYVQANTLAAKIQSMRNSIAPQKQWIREDSTLYEVDPD
jgi:hypothetical protein